MARRKRDAHRRRQSGEPVRAGAARQPEDAQILVVDDELVIREVLRDFLEAQGYRVASAATGAEALHWLQRNRPDVVLLDIFMPEVNGIDVLREARRMQPELSVVVVSGYVDGDLQHRVRALGAAACVSKPFDIHKLHALISERIPRSGN